MVERVPSGMAVDLVGSNPSLDTKISSLKYAEVAKW